jgi:plasmid stabilization system protein ParE
LQAIDKAASRIAAFPESCPLFRRNTRRIQLKRFPYWLYFRVSGEFVEVLAVLHFKRDSNQIDWDRQ